MRLGVDAIVAGDARRANHEFNLALAHDMKNPGLHVANALAYQIRARTGEPDLFNLAETGYLVALEQQYDFQSAVLQLAHLYFEHKHYAKAQQAAAYALKLDSSNIEGLYLLASASYTNGDVDLALWAIDRAIGLAPQDETGARMIPLIYGAAGLTDEANAYINERQNLFSQQISDKLRNRVVQWKLAYESVNAPENLTSLMQGQAEDQSPQGSSSDNVAPNENAFDSDNNGGNSEDLGPLAYAWSDCVQQLSDNDRDYQSGSGSEEGDETMAMPSLPSPCKGRAMPKMAIIDVVILRTNEFASSTNGINLLQNLAVTLQQTANNTITSGSGVERITSSTLSREVGIGTSSGSAIAYSLNISNATKQATDIIARPSLLVLDRQPAQFFSGSNVAIGLAGDDGTASSLEHVNIGVSLSVTPTFVNDTEMLLNVKAARSFFEPVVATSTFSQSLQTSRNMVSAATRVKFNETLVLSGLVEKETIVGSTGVPILKEIPGLSFLFSRKTTQHFNKTVLILITPKQIVANGEALGKVSVMQNTDKTESKLLQKTRAHAGKALDKKWPDRLHDIKSMSPEERAFSVRTKDIRLEDWGRPSRIQAILQDAVESL